MNDHDPIESELRAHFARRASTVEVTPTLGGPSTVIEAAGRRRADRHRRRMAAGSVATAAAVAAGLVVIARDPAQDVRTERNAPASAGQGLAAGAATGSSTGSASGSPRGWSSDSTIATTDPELAAVSLRLGPEFRFSGRYDTAQVQATGDRAADLAVAAEVAVGRPLRFIVASVQDADRLSPGKGGTDFTIGARPAKLISRRAATTITWDLNADQRVLVTAAGVDDATLEQWLLTLGQGDDGRWGFDPPAAAAGLTVVPTVTPERQSSRSMSWMRVAPDNPCVLAGYDLRAASGGTYELWGRLADSTRYAVSLPSVIDLSVPGLAVRGPAFASDLNGILATVADPTDDTDPTSAASGDTVVELFAWQDGGTPIDPAELAGLMFTPADGVLPVDVDDSFDGSGCKMAPPAVTVVPATEPPTTEPPTTEPPTTEPPTTEPPATTTSLQGA